MLVIVILLTVSFTGSMLKKFPPYSGMSASRMETFAPSSTSFIASELPINPKPPVMRISLSANVCRRSVIGELTSIMFINLRHRLSSMTYDWRALLKQNGYVNKVIGFRELNVMIGERKPPFSDEQKRRIEERWAAVKQRNPQAYSNQILAVNGVAVNVQTGEVNIDSYTTGYKEYSTTKQDYGENSRVWAAGSAGILSVIEKGERILVFGERTQNTFKVAGDIESVPAGFAEVGDGVSDNIFTLTVLREAEEEVGVPMDAVQVVQYLGLGRIRKWDKLYQDFHVDYLLSLPGWSWQDVENAFDKNNEKKVGEGESLEHKRIIPVRVSELPNFIYDQRERLGIRTLFTLDSFFELGLQGEGAKP